MRKRAETRASLRNQAQFNEQNILKVQCEVCGQNGLFQQLHQVAVLCGRQVGEDVVTLWREAQCWHDKEFKYSINISRFHLHTESLR